MQILAVLADTGDKVYDNLASGVDPRPWSSPSRCRTRVAGREANREVLVETGAFLRDVDEIASLVVAVHQGRRSTCATSPR